MKKRCGKPLKYKRLDIQLLRGIAVLGVIFNHTNSYLQGGFIGVDIFFVISGFYITNILKDQYKSTRMINLNIFYLKRLLRLMPTFAFVSIFICISMIFLNNPSGAVQNSAKTAFSTNLFVGNYIIQQAQKDYFADNAFYNPLMHFWTLSVEWQFYIIFPIIILFYVKHFYNKFETKKACALGLIILFGYFCLALSYPISSSDYYTITFRVWEFAVGIFCSFVRKNRTPNLIVFQFSRLMAFGTLLACMILIDKFSKLPGQVLVIPVAATFYLIYSGDNKIVYKSKLFKLLTHLGNLSYSLYLWHWPIYITIEYLTPNIKFKFLIFLIFTYTFSLFTFYLIEERFRHYPTENRRSEKFILKISSINILVAILIGFLSSEVLARQVYQEKLKTIVTGNIYNFNPIESIVFKECVYQNHVIFYTKNCLIPDNPFSEIINNKSITVIGDSHAKHLTLGLDQVFPTTNLIFIGIDSFHKVPNNKDVDFDKLIDDIVNQDLVIISSYWSEFGINEELEAILRKLSLTNNKVFLDLGTPKFSFSSFRCKYGVSLFISHKLCNNSYNYSVSRETLSDLNNILDKIPEVHPLYSYEAFCTKSECSMSKNRTIYFYDNNHLNKQGSIELIKFLVENDPDFNLK